jgi:hypothetical protein
MGVPIIRPIFDGRKKWVEFLQLHTSIKIMLHLKILVFWFLELREMKSSCIDIISLNFTPIKTPLAMNLKQCVQMANL